LRLLAHGIVPPLLAEAGLAIALADAADHAAIAVTLDLQETGRVDPAVERAVYFCCVEALQNATKHAGAGATGRMALKREGDTLVFCVEDDGRAGTQALSPHAGQGLRNLRERLLSVGGKLDTEVSAAGGLRVRGTVPVAAAVSVLRRSA
jgi:signal transduction histidine kinase